MNIHSAPSQALAESKRPRRFLLLVAAAITLSGVAPSETALPHARRRAVMRVPGARFGDPYPALTSEELDKFVAGQGDFTEVELVEDGLGPVFNGRSCSECHAVPSVGGGSERMATRIATWSGGVYDPLVNYGGPLLQGFAIGAPDGCTHDFHAETVPAAATIVAHRRTTPLYGLGLVDATPDSVFFLIAEQEAQRHDGTAGRVAMVNNIVDGTRRAGKFGWKAQNPSLFQFAADAYAGEIGITNELFPTENCPVGNCSELEYNPVPALNDGSGVSLLRDYMLRLGPPPRGTITPEARAGEALFDQIGCTSCHLPAIESGASDLLFLNHQTYHPYSDFLLHDMGSLGDGIEQEDAAGQEMRTAPLWGLREVTRYLHDGRAATLPDAIDAHDGQGKGARDRFQQLDERSKELVLTFLGSL